jgi:hypothetical protein
MEYNILNRFRLKILPLALAISSCLDGNGFFTQDHSTDEKANHSEVASSDQVSKYVVMDATKSLTLSTDTESEVGSSEVTFPAGALAIGSEVTVQPASDIATDAMVASLSLETGIGITNVSSAVAVTSLNNANESVTEAAEPFSIAISLPQSSAFRLQEKDFSLLVIIYKTFGATDKIFKMGLIPRSEIEVVGGLAKFQTITFGVFQAAYLTAPVTTAPKEVETSVPILMKAEEKSMPPIEWSLNAISGANRSVEFSFSIQGMKDLDHCVGFVDVDAVAPWDYTEKITSKILKFSPKNSAAHVVQARFSCVDNVGRDSGPSPWKSFNFAALQQPDLVAPNVPLVNVSSYSNDARPTWNWQSGGAEGAGVFRFKLNNADLVQVSETTAKSFRPNTALPDGSHTLYVQERDAAGNWSVSGFGIVTVDTIKPAVVVSSNASSPTNLSPITINLEFSEAVVGLAASDIAVTNATLGNFSGSGKAYTFHLVPSADGTVSFDLSADSCSDAAGNGNNLTSYSVSFSSNRPAVTITADKSSPTNASTINYTVSFSDPVSGFAAADLAVQGASVGGFSGSGMSYSFVLTPSIEGVIAVTIPQNVAFDVAGNGNLASTTLQIIRDISSPTASITSIANNPTNQQPLAVTVTFSEDVNGFALIDLTLGNAVASSFSGTGSDYSFELTPISEGNVSVDLAASLVTDLAGNANSAAAQFLIGYDTTSPVFTSLVFANGVEDGYINASEAANANPIAILDAIGYVTAYYTQMFVSGPTCDGSQTYASNQIPLINSLTADGSYAFCVKLADAAGNITYGSSSIVIRDTVAPTSGGSLASSAVTNSSATLSWTAGSDDRTTASNLSYKIYHSLSNNIGDLASAEASSYVTGPTQNMTTYNVTGLAQGKYQFMTVIVFDQAGNAAVYPTATFQTLGFSCDTGSLSASCGVTSTKTLYSGETITGIGSITINSGIGLQMNPNTREGQVTISLSGNLTVNGFLNSNGMISAANITIASGGIIKATGRGFAGGASNFQGSGPGGGAVVGTGGAGGSYGGVGGFPSSGAATGTLYGDEMAPISFGSGGGSGGTGGLGGNGGGALKLTASQDISVFGTLSADGTDGTIKSGGGAGGSLWIQAQNLMGTGLISAKGGLGAGSAPSGGGGGGGRIKFDSGINKFAGSINVNGAGNLIAAAAYVGAPGTYRQALNFAVQFCDVGNLSSTCTITSTRVLTSAIDGANLSIDTANGELKAPTSSDAIYIKLWGDFNIYNTSKITGNVGRIMAKAITIHPGALISANGHGFQRGGPEAGAVGNPGNGGGAGNGGMGGAGAAAGGAGGMVYTGLNMDMPMHLASAGGPTGNGAYAGGAGGGKIRLVARTNLTVNGVISANGLNGAGAGAEGAGGGAGGNVWLFAQSISGTGTITANGGAGGGSTSGGGGGGGGIIAFYANTAPTGALVSSPTVTGGASPPGAVVGSNGIKLQKIRGADFDKIFVTSLGYPGNLGGTGGANTKCSTSAT